MNFVYTEEQENIFDAIKNKENFIAVDARAGSAKEQPLTSLVLTPDRGYITMGEVKVGDKVCSPNNTINTVLAIHPQGVKRVYEIHFSDGAIVECGIEHLWHVNSCNFRDRKPRVFSTREMMSKTLITKKKKARVFDVPLTEVKFNKKDLPIDPYVLGALLGDGCLTGSTILLSCHVDDMEIIDRVRNSIDDDMCFSKAKNTSDNGLQFTISKSKSKAKVPSSLRLKLDDLGLYGKYSHNKFIPEIYLHASFEQRLDILRGLLDADGSVGERNRVSYSSTSKELIDGVVHLCKSLGGSAYVVNGKTDKDRVNHCYTVIVKMNTINPFYLKRKAKKVTPRAQNRVRKSMLKIVKTDRFVEQQCISLDGDHLYITDDFTTTHNTTSVLEGIKRKRDSDRVLIISFNKKIAMENQSKFEDIPNVECSTLHSLAIRYVGGSVMTGRGLPLKEVDTRYQRYVDIYRAFTGYCTSGTVSSDEFAKKSGYSSKMASVIRDIFEYMSKHNIYNFAAMAKLYAIGLEDNPVKYDYIVFDEFADANECYISAFYNMKADCKIVMFDEAQRLYGFNGAVENITKHLPSNAKTYPLTKSFRCSEEIASKVMNFMKDRYDHNFRFYGTDSEPPKKKNYMILTRGNLELLNVIIELNNARVGFKHLESLERAMSAIKAAKSRDLNVFLKTFPELEDLVTKESLKVKDEYGNYPTPLKVAIREAKIVNAIVEAKNQEGGLIRKLPYNVDLLKSILVLDKDLDVKKSTFTYKNITISTAHAIKGAEADTVYICDDLNDKVSISNKESSLMDGEEDEVSEVDLMLYYVACTRAKTKLFNAVKLGDNAVSLEDFIRDEVLIDDGYKSVV